MVSVTDQLQLYTVLMTIKTVLYHKKELLKPMIVMCNYYDKILILISQTSIEGLALY